MTVEKASLNDAKELYTLEGKLFAKENYPLSRASFSYHIKNNLLHVAKVDEKIVAYALVLIKRKTPKLYSIGVAKEQRGNKISEILLKSIEKELKSLGFASLLLEVRVDNEAALSLYKKRGFEIVKRLKSFYKDGCDAYLMELKEL